MVPLTQNNLFILETGFRSGPRGFSFFKGDPDAGGTPVYPAELLGLEPAALIVGNLETLGAQAVPIALSRLLVPCLQYSGSGRHLVVEEWTAEDLRGDSLPEDTRTRLAAELAREQAEEWQRVVAGRRPPEGSLAEAFWEAQTDLPLLPPRFEDPELGRLAKALYFFLVPPGEGEVELTTTDVMAKVAALRKSRFAALGLDIPPRRLNVLFKKLLATAVIFASQITGEVAFRLVTERLQRCPGQGPAELSEDERALLEFQYGACPELGNVNIRFFYGNGPLVGLLLDHLYRQFAFAQPQAERDQAAVELHKCMHLLREFRRRRSAARAEERRENRQRRPRSRLDKSRRPEGEADRRSKRPEAPLEAMEELEFVAERILPRLRPHDARRLQALLAAKGDRAEAAKRLGISRTEFSRQFRQTTRPNIQCVLSELAEEGRAG